MFARGQLPMPFKQLAQVLEDREHQDQLREEGLEYAGGNHSGNRQNNRTEQARGCRRTRGKRLLSSVAAHRRARKALCTISEASICLEHAFQVSLEVGRPVEQALILLGTSYLSPKEIYSISFPSATSDISSASAVRPAASVSGSPDTLEHVSRSPTPGNAGVGKELGGRPRTKLVKGDPYVRKLVSDDELRVCPH
ncbi:unnamed protein product [Choristocarpus tenellus]